MEVDQGSSQSTGSRSVYSITLELVGPQTRPGAPNSLGGVHTRPGASKLPWKCSDLPRIQLDKSMTSTKPQSTSLSEAEIRDTRDHIAKTKDLLLHAFHKASAKQRSELQSNLQVLQDLSMLYQLISGICEGLSKARRSSDLKNWLPKGEIVKMVQACCNQRYEDHDIESIFYKHGGVNGLLVFHLGTKDYDGLVGKTLALPKGMIADLAKRCGKEEINAVVPVWIKTNNQKSTIAFFSPSRLSITDVPSRVRSYGDPPSALSLG